MGQDQQDLVLREFLSEWMRDQKNGDTVREVRHELREMRGELQSFENRLGDTEAMLAGINVRLNRHGRTLRTHLGNQGDGSDEAPKDSGKDTKDTGAHQVLDLERVLQFKETEIKRLEAQVAQKTEAETWWKRRTVQWIVAGLAWMVTSLATAGAAIAWAASRK